MEKPDRVKRLGPLIRGPPVFLDFLLDLHRTMLKGPKISLTLVYAFLDFLTIVSDNKLKDGS